MASNPEPPIPRIALTPALDVPLSAGKVVPLVLFPVRLETRFFRAADGSADLCIRVYPDTVHIDTHESGLTEQEITWGKHFWKETWRHEGNAKGQQEAWSQLAERFEPPRAAWIANQLAPKNPGGAFPSPPTKAEAWTRSPKARLLPKRWWVLGYAGDKLTIGSGKPIDQALAAGPDPKFTGQPEGELQIDPGMKWMVDFAEAEIKGMGIRLKLNQEEAQGFDFLLVFGTSEDANMPNQIKTLVEMFKAHYYTEGVSVISPGTPSNNTSDAPSGFSSSADLQMATYMPGGAATDNSNASLFTLLGVDAGTASKLVTLVNASKKAEVDSYHMNRALWPATWGYFLRQMMGVKNSTNFPTTTLTISDLEWARQHFNNWVRPFGPLPTLRIGKQPYGVLPVTSLDSWKPRTDEPQPSKYGSLQKFLLDSREVWRRSFSNVPTVRSASDPDRASEQNIKQIFSMDGISSHYSVHHLMGIAYLRELWKLSHPGEESPAERQLIEDWFLYLAQENMPILGKLNLLGSPFMMFAAFSGWSMQLTKPLVRKEIASDIDLLLNATKFDQLSSDVPSETNSFFRAVLRHGMLLEVWRAAVDLLFSSGPAQEYWSKSQEQEFVNLEPSLNPAPKEILNRPAQGITNGPVGDFLVKLRKGDPNLPPHTSRLLEFRESLEHLKTLSAPVLQPLFAGTLDLCSHRLDAWITSFATKRLAEVRKDNPTGLILGGYGWVIDLRPARPPTPDAPVPGVTGTVFRLPDNAGYTLAPSLAQASTAAVLRSGHLTNSDGDNKDLLAIDLTSERVRLAQWLLDGVRHGQSLGAMIGYRFERRLQDAGLGYFIPYLRHAAPLVANKLAETADVSNTSVESLAANNVVDGLLLQQKWKEALKIVPVHFYSTLWELFKLRRPEVHTLIAHLGGLTTHLNLLNDVVDAVSDALIAETVHQAVQGNPQRTACTLDAIARGAAPPPELEVVRTPRTGIALTHRVVTLLKPNPGLPVGWESPAVSLRADAEPSLNAWVARLLGNPQLVRCLVVRRNPSTNEAVTIEVHLNKLRLTPLDLVYAAESSRDAQPSEIEQRIFHYVRSEGLADDAAALSIDPKRPAGWPSSDLSYGEFSELLRSVRRLITGARAIDASELALRENNQPAGVDLGKLKTRATTAAKALDVTISTLNDSIAAAANDDLVDLRKAILRAAHYGIPGAIPVTAKGTSDADREALRLQGTSIAEELRKRQALLIAPIPTSGSTPADPVKHEIARLQIIFGESFLVLPEFNAAQELQKSLNNSSNVQNPDTLAVVKWFQRASRVREGVSRLDASLRYAEALKTGEQLNLRVAQLPHRDEDRWVGLPLEPEKPELSSSRFSLIVQSDKTLKVTEPLTGLFIDEWVEVVPNASETTGVAFHYDRPDAEPPQCILVAVPPDLSQPWNVWSLQQVLLETLDLARIRAVDPEAVEDVGHYLPATYFAVNETGDSISTDLTALK